MVSNYINYFTEKFKEKYNFDVGTSETIESYQDKHFDVADNVVFTFRKLEPTLDNGRVTMPLIIYVEVAELVADDVIKVLNDFVFENNNLTASFNSDERTIEVIQQFNMPFLQQPHIESNTGYKDLYVINCTLIYSQNINLALSNDCRVEILGEEIPKECLLSFAYDEQVVTEPYIDGLEYKEAPVQVAHTFRLEILVQKDNDIFNTLIFPSDEFGLGGMPPLITLSFQIVPNNKYFQYSDLRRKSLTLVNTTGNYIRASLTLTKMVLLG